MGVFQKIAPEIFSSMFITGKASRVAGSIAAAPPLQNTSRVCSWYFFAYIRVPARVPEGSSGRQGSRLRVKNGRFCSLQAIILSGSLSPNGPKSARGRIIPIKINKLHVD
ncbi:MAG: hypothetical protein HHJ12_18345 [Glaciimonas sp.]|nr:hypothetical protein [Glaciimonas sp.]